MNQNRIDKIGVATVVDYFCRMGHIDPHIAFDDKIPVWDGNIDVHKSVDSNSKEDIEFTIHVQVKSSEHKSNNFNTDVVQTINIHDMELYKGKGGTLLIKVLVNKNKAQLYFAYLGKIQINKLLESINDTQKTKDIKCYKAPKNYKELYSHLRTIYLQANHNLITLEELKDKKGWSFNVIAGPMENNTNPLDWIATNNIDVLVKLEGLSEQFYLSPGPARLYANVDVNQAVTVDGVEYPFTKVTFGTNSEGHIISIDNFLKYQYHDFSNDNRQKNKIDITITPISDYVDERLNQLKFLQAIITHGYFCIGNVRLEVAFSELSEEDISSLKSDILFLQKTSDFFEQIHVSNHFNFKGLTKDEYDKLIFLVKLFNDEKPEALPCLEEPYTCFKIGDYNLCFGISKLENIGFRFNDINNCFSSGIYQSGEEMSSAVHSYFFSKNVFPDNLNYSDIVAQYKKYNVSKEYLTIVNFDVLCLISQYDTTDNKLFLNAAKDLIEWIIASNADEDSICIFKINLLQIYTRLDKPFSSDDRQFLLNINKYNSSQLNFAASVLLKEVSRAQSNYDKLTDAERSEIVQFPIYNLYKNLINNQ